MFDQMFTQPQSPVCRDFGNVSICFKGTVCFFYSEIHDKRPLPPRPLSQVGTSYFEPKTYPPLASLKHPNARPSFAQFLAEGPPEASKEAASELRFPFSMWLAWSASLSLLVWSPVVWRCWGGGFPFTLCQKSGVQVPKPQI